MFKKKITKKTYFKDSWLSDKEYSDWIARGPRNTSDRCCICKVNFELGNMGSGLLTSHGKGKNHDFKVMEAKKIVDFFNVKSKNIFKPFF